MSMSNATSHQGGGLDGQVVLIVQRNWVIATALAKSFEEKGASAVLAKVFAPDLTSIPNLCAAVVDGQSRELCRLLEARGIPFVLYTARDQIEADATGVPIVLKPASAAEVVARVESLLSGRERENPRA
jgi:DNA-binding response OmpR family regulator